jgi:hypothetical protein
LWAWFFARNEASLNQLALFDLIPDRLLIYIEFLGNFTQNIRRIIVTKKSPENAKFVSFGGWAARHTFLLFPTGEISRGF